MKFDRSKEWWLKRLRRERIDHPIEAGSAENLDDQFMDIGTPLAPGEAHLAFGRFVSLMRRRARLSVEQLAESGDIDVEELLRIESDPHYVAEPRTVYQLAQRFDVPTGALAQVAGLKRFKDQQLSGEAVRFAARSEPVEELTADESAALEAFILVLSKQEL